MKKPVNKIPSPVGILGYGVEGKSTCRYLRNLGIKSIMIFDKQEPDSLPSGVSYGGSGNYLSKLDKIKTLFRSAGIRPDLKEIEKFKGNGGILTSQIEYFFNEAPAGQIIGISGTLGKGTCATLLCNMLKSSGQSALLGGNIGTAALDILPDVLDSRALAVLELSSFQLSTLRRSPHIGIVLKTTAEHLDWHVSIEEYWDHKANLIRFQSANDFTIHNADAVGSCWIADTSNGKKIGFGINGPKISVTQHYCSWKSIEINASDLSIPGHFNLENIAAAGYAASVCGVDNDNIISEAKSFKGLEHRLENAGSNGKITFFNDSYATRPEASIGAVNSFPETDIGLILGGSEKYADFSELSGKISGSENIKAIALIGQTAERIKISLDKYGAGKSIEIRICENLELAVIHLLKFITKGVILLSPACASFGLFANYKERGKKFKEIAKKYITESQALPKL